MGSVSGRGSADPDGVENPSRPAPGASGRGLVRVPVRGGPIGGRTKIVPLGADGVPPVRLRTRDGAADGPDAWHVYRAESAADSVSGWAYAYVGPEPTGP